MDVFGYTDSVSGFVTSVCKLESRNPINVEQDFGVHGINNRH